MAWTARAMRSGLMSSLNCAGSVIFPMSLLSSDLMLSVDMCDSDLFECFLVWPVCVCDRYCSFCGSLE